MTTAHRTILALMLALPAFSATVFRVDPTPVMTTAGNAPAGGFPALYAVAGASINVCTDAACATPATTYTDATGNTACPLTAPVVLAGTSLCTTTTGPQGQFGFWLAPGTYYYRVTFPSGQSFGSFPMTSNTAGVTSLTGGTGISVNNGGIGSVTVTNAGVISFNGRTGVVVPTTGDYTWTQIGGSKQGNTNVPQMAGTNSGAAGATLCDDANGNATTSGCSSVIPAGTQTQYLRVQPNTGNNTTYQFANLPTIFGADYSFPPQTPGGSLSVGSNTITMTPCPLGMNGTDTNHYVYIVNGVGTAEAALITGGTCTAGATTGTIIVTCANTHSGAWQVQTAAGGLHESIWSLSNGGFILYGTGALSIHAPVYNRPMTIWIEGLGFDSTNFNVAADFPTSAAAVFNWTSNPGGATILMPGGMRKFTLFFPQPDSTNVALYTHWPPGFLLASTHRPLFEDINVQNAWDGWKSAANDGLTVRNVTMSFYHRGFDLDGQTDTVTLTDIHLWPTGNTTNQDTAFTASTTGNVGIYLGNVQSFLVTNYTSIAGGGPYNGHSGAGGPPVGEFVNCEFDTVGGFVQSDGIVKVTNTSSSLTGATNAFTVRGGLLTLVGPQIYVNGGSTGHVMVVNINQVATGPAALATPGLVVIGGEVVDFETGVSVVTATTSGAFAGTAAVRLIGTHFDRGHDVVNTAATVVETAGTGTMEVTAIGTRHTPVVSGSGTAFNLASDNYHVLTGNYGGGWGCTFTGSPTKLTLSGNPNFLASCNIDRLLNATKTTGKVTASTLLPLVGPNYIASETGANNAIVGTLTDAAGVAIPVADGLCVTQQLAHTLQAGANTYNLNATGAVSIKKHTNAATDITAYAVTGRPTFCYNTTGPVWMDMAQ